jgi:maltose O-acetyltransferase
VLETSYESKMSPTVPRVSLWQKVREELQPLSLRLSLTRALLSPLPPNVGTRVRVQVMRMAGFRIGRGTMFWGMPIIVGTGSVVDKLSIGEGCWLNVGCYLELGDEIRIGNDVSFGPETMILTSTHDTRAGTTARRAVEVSRKPVVIKDGAWLGARCTILPGVTVGEGAIVAAGAVVHRDVPPNTLVAGVPARVVKELR